MPTYCTDDDVTGLLPDNLPDTLDTALARAPYIARGSARAEAAVGPGFAAGTHGGAQKFPDVDDTPGTPEPVRELATYYAVRLMLYHIHFAVGVEAGDEIDRLSRHIEALAREIRDGVVDLGAAYGTGDVPAISSGAGRPVFTRGRYDADGTLLDDAAGSLDGLVS